MSQAEMITLIICTTLVLLVVVSNRGNMKQKEIELERESKKKGKIIVRTGSVMTDEKKREEIRKEIEKETNAEVIVLPYGCEIAGMTLNAEEDTGTLKKKKLRS